MQPDLWKDGKRELVEPPSCRPLVSTVVFIGRNNKGHWVAQQQNGLFVSRAQALKDALFENDNHLETIVELPPGIELDINGTISQASSPARLA